MDENSDKGTLVGSPVSAADTDVLTYGWTAEGSVADGQTPAATRSAFKVDRATGQISVNGDLDFETTASYDGNGYCDRPVHVYYHCRCDHQYRQNVNDKPVFGDNLATEGTVVENADPKQPLRLQLPSGGTLTYTATDVDDTSDPPDASADEAVGISKTGPDADAFVLDPNTAGTGATAASATLAFADDETIDYEKQKSYSVTIVATDARGLSETIDVTIKVDQRQRRPAV